MIKLTLILNPLLGLGVIGVVVGCGMITAGINLIFLKVIGKSIDKELTRTQLLSVISQLTLITQGL